MPNDFPIEETPKAPMFLVDCDPGDETDVKPLACDTCGSTEKGLSVTKSSSEPGHVGRVSCGQCIFDRGNAAALRLALDDGFRNRQAYREE